MRASERVSIEWAISVRGEVASPSPRRTMHGFRQARGEQKEGVVCVEPERAQHETPAEAQYAMVCRV